MNLEHCANLRYLHEKLDQTVELGFGLLDKIERAALHHKAELIIIDNISKLLPDSLKADMVTVMITMLNRVRNKTGASILVIGHTTKGNPRIAVQPTDYFGSSMLQNFFSELSFLDTTKDGNFFLCHSKTKHAECYNQTVPVLTRGPHPTAGVGFTFEALRSVADIQLPFSLVSETKSRKRDLNGYTKQILRLAETDSCQVIADIFMVDRRSIYRILDAHRLAS